MSDEAHREMDSRTTRESDGDLTGVLSDHPAPREFTKTKRTRRSKTPPPRGSSSPIMSTDIRDHGSPRDITNDETISILDPRRFTPTLHANLVSEILALRRDQEEKLRIIESLETSLHTAKEEHERLQGSLIDTSKEGRSLRRQLSLLEGGTSSALGELARERDEAVDCHNETKKRLDLAQTKIRDRDNEIQRVQELCAREKECWENERRKFQHQLHVAESRLKMMLSEVAEYQAKQISCVRHELTPDDESDDGNSGKNSGKESEVTSVRTMSLTDSIRTEPMSGLDFRLGNSLADELSFDEHINADKHASDLSHRASQEHRRTLSRESVASRRADRTYSIESLKRPGSWARSRPILKQSVLDALQLDDGQVKAREARSSYVDAGVQFSPSFSPLSSPEMSHFKTATSLPATQREETPQVGSPVRADVDIEANQRRKRVQISRPLFIEPPGFHLRMVSASAQTIELPLSPPKTPQSLPSCDSTCKPAVISPCMVTACTQTEEVGAALRAPNTSAPKSPLAAAYLSTGVQPASPPLEIPIISIQPPTSRPPTPKETRLPQYFKHFGCQVSISSTTQTKDACAQTEGIRVDKRLALLPPHLQPSAISSRPTSPSPSNVVSFQQTTSGPQHVPPRNPRRLVSDQDLPDLSTSPTPSGEHAGDLDRRLSETYSLSTKRGVRRRANRNVGSIFGGYDTASSDDDNDFGDVDISDIEFRTALSAPRPLSKAIQVVTQRPFGALKTGEPKGKAVLENFNKSNGADIYDVFSARDKENQYRKHSRRASRTSWKNPAQSSSLGALSRPSAIRKAAIIQSSIASEQSRSRSPSLPEGRRPPFPIPTRESSRKSRPGLGTSSDGQQSPVENGSWHRRASSRSSQHSYSVRKVRSAAALARVPRYRRHGSRSPPPLSPSTEAPESPRLPPLPRNDLTTPLNGRARRPSAYRRHHHELSGNTDNTNNTNNTALTTDAAASHSTGIVDAIAQTMVGEWMLKYVRRGRSFSVPESGGKDDSSGDRHKRWVWLAPYERSILWSSRQPSSGSALLGKTGRKLTIQSVLDVKDDNAAPKVMPLVFNRSILILTPQRALKFTATSAERHYLWLTALSFLAHSSQAIPEIISVPRPGTKSQRPPEFQPSQPKLKRGRIRDSIRIAKNRAYGSKPGFPSVRSILSDSSSRVSEAPRLQLADSSPNLSGGNGGEQWREAAEAPFIPRFSDRVAHQGPTHGRKRSNTGGHTAPPLSFRGFSGPAGSGDGLQGSGASAGTVSDETIGSGFKRTLGSGNTTWSTSLATSRCTSEAPRTSNYFDAIGTVRMEAFISPVAYWQDDEDGEEVKEASENSAHNAGRRSKEARRQQSRSRDRAGRHHKPGRAGDEHPNRFRYSGSDDFFARDDPFQGF